MNSKPLRRMYERELSRGPFPTDECYRAGIKEGLHGELLMFLADIAGIASRGEGLLSASPREKQAFRKIASTGLNQRFPALHRKITRTGTPVLYELVCATERAQILILEALRL